MRHGLPMEHRPYHHGTLRATLLEVAEAMLERDGPDRLSLRAVARAAGVSHAAPAHHFGDLRGLLTAVAAGGFRRFTAAMREAAAAGEMPLRELGRVYVRFARDHPGLFLLMFRSGLLDGRDAELGQAMREAFGTLAEVAAAAAMPEDGASTQGRALASWCLVHGFSMLLLDGRLPSEPGADELLETIFWL